MVESRLAQIIASPYYLRYNELMSDKIILGIDPGSRTAGFAVIKKVGRKLEYIDSGVMKYAQLGEFLLRLGEISRSCEQLLAKYSPDEVAFESLIYVKSPTALIKLAQARGAMIAAFLRDSEIPISEYSPNLVKSTVVGHGHADKDAVKKGLGLIFKGQKIKKFQTHDESDALAIAVCHALNTRKGGVITSSKGGSLKQLGEQILRERKSV